MQESFLIKTPAPDASVHPASRTPGADYRTDIDGLRALAVVAVVLFHAHVPFLPGGFVGVDIFFVISGYLIGSHIYRDVRSGTFSLTRFYARRAKRILPALFTVLAVSTILALFILPADEMRLFCSDALATIASVSNIYFLKNMSYFAAAPQTNPLLMTWSLGVEEQFYIIVPLLMLSLASIHRRRQQRGRSYRLGGYTLACIGIFAALSLVLSIYGVSHFRDATFYLLPTRAWELGIGVCMALYEADYGAKALYGGTRFAALRSLLGLAGVLLPIFLYNAGTPFPGAAALAPTLGAALLLSSPAAWLNRRVFSALPLRWIGWLSYSWYLWHWPLLTFVRISFDREMPLTVSLVVVTIGLALAFLTYRFVEQPFRRSSSSPRKLLLHYGLVVACFLPVFLFIHTKQGLPDRFPQAETAIASFQQYSTDCITLPKDNAPATSIDCSPPPDGRPTVALIGDSHAGAISSNLRAIANQSGYRFLTFVHGQCPPLLGVLDSRGYPERDVSCKAFNDTAIEVALRDKSVKYVILAANWAGPMEWAGRYVRIPEKGSPKQTNLENLAFGLTNTIKVLKQADKKVIVMQDYDALKFDPRQRVLARLIPFRGWIDRVLQPGTSLSLETTVTSSEIFFKENESVAAVVQAVATRLDVTTFDLRTGLCANGRCAYSTQTSNFYKDTNHLTPAGVEIALRGFHL